MNIQNTTFSAAAATHITDEEIKDLELGSSKLISVPGTTPESNSATVAVSKPIEGEIILPAASNKKAATTTSENDAKLASIADRIRRRTQRGVLVLVDNGHDLIAVKEKMRHGQFGDWLKREFGWSERTAQNYMNAAMAFDYLAARGCTAASVALLPPAALYDFDGKSEEYKNKCVENIMSGDIAKAAKRSKKEKAAANKNASPTASTDKNRDAAEELAKIIAGALPHAIREKIDGNAGFKSRAFGELLGKAIATSFGAASKRAA